MAKMLIDDCFHEIRNGASIKQGIVDGGYPITRIETISNDRFNREKMGYAGINDIEKYSAFVLDDEDLLMSHINSVQYLGRTVLYKKEDNESIIHGMNLLRLRPQKDIVCPAYIKYYFYGRKFRDSIAKITKKSVNQASFAVNDLKKISINLPDKDEQESIVEKLSRLESIIEFRTIQLEEYDHLIKSRFVEMFGDPVANNMGWDVVKLKKLSTKILSGNTPKGGSQVYVDDGIMFFRSQNVWKNRIELDDIAYIDEKTHKSMAKSSLKHKDILMTKTGRINTENSSLGRAAMYMGADDEANINGHVYMIRMNEKAVKEFVLFIITTLEYRDYIRSVCVGGIDKRQLNKNHIEDFPIIMPPRDKQEEFVSIWKQVNKLKAKVQKSLEETQLLFDSFMQKYFD